MKKINFYNLFYIFIIASIYGWLIEVIWTLIKKGVLINHSAVVIGPFNMVYGISAVFISLFLTNYKDMSNIKLFLIGFIGGTILEYILSVLIEWYVGFPAWNYYGKFLNINGRVCLPYSLIWGFIAIIWIKYVYPFIIDFIEFLNKDVGMFMMKFLIVFLIIDIIFSYTAILRAKEYDHGIPPKNKYEEFLDNTFNTEYLTNMYNDNWKS